MAFRNIILRLCTQCSYYSCVFDHIRLEDLAKPACLLLSRLLLQCSILCQYQQGRKVKQAVNEEY